MPVPRGRRGRLADRPKTGTIQAVGSQPPRPSFTLVALLVLGGAGLGLLIVGVITPWGWTMFVPGSVALVISLVATWTIQKSRDKTLR